MAERQSYHREIFPERLYLQAPQGLSSALDKLAARQRTSRSELVRRALMREVEANGLSLGEPEQVVSHG
jgi:hypothetical protein